MSVRSFQTLFSADAVVRTLPFETEGQPGELLLKRMDARSLNEFQTQGVEFRRDGDAVTSGKVDVNAKQIHLLAHTVVGGYLPRKSVSVADQSVVWGRTEVPTDPRRALQFWATEKLSPEFWDFVVVECMAENGLLEGQAKN